MAKAVLVMDMPEDCKQCVFCRGLNACKLKKYLVKQIMEGGKPDWCPLRELPERSDHPEHCDNGRFDAGWNGCLDAIEGGAHGKEQNK
jgi:hypothetical protein